MPGGGNHRGSIFRLHVGTALLSRGEWTDQIRDTWAVGTTAKGDIRRGEYPLERAVSRYIGSMPFLWLEVGDPPSAASERGIIESGSIALLSNFGRTPVDPPSSTWLGLDADREAVRCSGLWNVNHVADTPNPEFLDCFERWLRRG